MKWMLLKFRELLKSVALDQDEVGPLHHALHVAQTSEEAPISVAPSVFVETRKGGAATVVGLADSGLISLVSR